jgi:histidyl-tRNA synthetase
MVEGATELGLIPVNESNTQVLVAVFDASTQENSLTLAAQIRQAEIRTEVYPAIDNVGKQFKLANQKNIPVVVIVGPDEAANKTITVKDMRSGEQQTVPQSQIISTLTQLLGF